MTDPIRAALERLIELETRYSAQGADPDMSDWDDAIAAARAALDAAAMGELSPKEVEAQDAFTQMRDEILNLSDGLEVNEVLGIIDDHTPEWV